jgi:hypothetical protein
MRGTTLLQILFVSCKHAVFTKVEFWSKESVNVVVLVCFGLRFRLWVLRSCLACYFATFFSVNKEWLGF